MAKQLRKRRINEYHPHMDKVVEHNAVIQIKLYDDRTLLEFEPQTVQEALALLSQHDAFKLWINIDGVQKDVVYKIGKFFDIHKLFLDDILSIGQRAKMDDVDDGVLFMILPILRWDSENQLIEKEQLSIILGDRFLVTFQEEALQDPFNSIRTAMRNSLHPIRYRDTDFLLYNIIDAVVDDYFNVLDAISERIESLEDQLSNNKIASAFLSQLAVLRKDVLFIKRNISPVRDVVNSLWLNDIGKIDVANKKYFKDILDHIFLAIEYNENYRESNINLQDLYMNQLNMKTNDVMKTLTVVTTLLAPAMLIASIYGMNFDRMPLVHFKYGYEVIIGLCILFSMLMLWYFKKKKWY
jgi:magnesium transporter